MAYPTETFYGLGVDAHNETALLKLQEMKGREGAKPFPVLLPDLAALSRYSVAVPPLARTLMQRYWPGPLTIVLEARNLPALLMNERGGVGFRISAHPLARELVREFGRCVTTTSANLAKQKPARSAEEVREMFSRQEVFCLDGGTTPGEEPSTVVEFTCDANPRLLREGAIPWKEIHG